jgi:glutamate-ammonia-ligase adenylyltransferase
MAAGGVLLLVTPRLAGHYRRLQHAQRLNEHNSVEVDDVLRRHYADVQALWEAVFGQPDVV